MEAGLQKILLLFLLFCGLITKAQVRFTASISPSEIGKNEYAQLKLMVENARDVQAIDPPLLRNFTIVSGPNQESGMSSVNGNVKRYIALNFILRPKSVGNFSIPPATAKADGADYKSNAVSIRVVANPTGNNPGGNYFASPFAGIDPFTEPAPKTINRDFIIKKGEDPLEKIRKNMFVKLEVDKTSCYVGEPVVATYKLYTRLKSESNMVKNPSFNGFSVIDLQQPDDMSYHVEKMDGREYNVYTIRKAQLYPLLPGNLELGPAEIENNVHFIKAEYINQRPDFFDNMMSDLATASIPSAGMEDQKVILQNKPVMITVKSLPDLNRPSGFKGATGNFKIETRVEKNTFTTDDGGKLAVIISGSGNLQMINAPQVNWPEGIEGFDSRAVDDLYKGTVPVSGRKIFEFPFTVSKPGTYTIPALAFSFFDPEQGTYKTVETRPLEVTVTKGTGKPKKVSEAVKTVKKDSYLVSFFKNRLRVVSLVAALIIIGLILWLKRDSKKEKQIAALKKENEEKQAAAMPAKDIIDSQEHPFTLAEENLLKEDAKAFYLALNDGLKNYLSKKFLIPPEDLNKKNITEQVDKKGISNETAMQLYALIDDIEFQLYTPFVDKEKMKDHYDRANDVVQLLNTYKDQAKVNL